MPETLWDEGPVLYSAPGVFPMGSDSVLLADFASGISCRRAVDLGAGSGILSILLAVRISSLQVTAVELEENACRLALQNFAANGLTDRVRLVSGDLRSYRELLPPGGTDLVISNPPYFGAGSGPTAGAGLQNARGDASCSVADLCSAAGWTVRWGGSFCLCFRPERLCDLFCALRENGLEPKRLRPVRHDLRHAVNLLLVEAKRGGRPGLSWENDLLLRNPDGTETDELRRIYHRGDSRQPEL